MSFSFDRSSGMLHGGDEHIAALVALRKAGWDKEKLPAGDSQTAAVVQAVVEADLWQGEQIHPAIGAIVEVVTDPWCMVEVTVSNPGETSALHRGWFVPGTAVVGADNGDGTVNFRPLPIGLLPAALANLAELGPRPDRQGNVPSIGHPIMEIGMSSITEIFSHDAASRQAAVAALTNVIGDSQEEIAGAINAGDYSLVAIALTFGTASTGVQSSMQQYIDTPEGMLQVFANSLDPQVMSLHPVTSRQAWQFFNDVFPPQNDVTSLSEARAGVRPLD